MFFCRLGTCKNIFQHFFFRVRKLRNLHFKISSEENQQTVDIIGIFGFDRICINSIFRLQGKVIDDIFDYALIADVSYL